MPREFVLRPDAAETIGELAAPQVAESAQALAEAIPNNVPVHEGVARQVYSSLSVVAGEDNGARVVGFPFLWHWLEYGTRWSVPYRPIENTARALGFTYEAR